MITTNDSAQIQILRRPDCPAALLEQHINHQDEDIRSTIASNLALNEAQQNQLADDGSVAVRLALLSNPALSPSIMARLFEDANLRAALATALSAAREDTNLSEVPEAAFLVETAVSEAHLHQVNSNSTGFNEAQQTKFLEEGDEQQLAELASHPDLSKEMQNKLLQYEITAPVSSDSPVNAFSMFFGGSEPKSAENSVLVALASNPFLFEEVQEKLASTGSPAVRLALAANPNLNEKQQNYLATTGSDQVKRHLAMNPSLIAAIQSLLADDEKYDVRAALAANPALDKAYLDKLMCDNDTNVKCGLASNPALPIDLQQHIANSECDNRRQLEWVLASLAKNPSLTDELMEKFAVSDINGVRESLAKNSSLPEPLQARLIANNSGKVLRNLAGNSALKVAQQAELAQVGDVDVRLALLGNPSLDKPIKMRVIAAFTKHDLSRAESDLDYAEKKASRLDIEYKDACQNYEISLGMSMSFLSFLTSDEKLDRLYDKTIRVQERGREAWSEYSDLGDKCRKLKCALEQQPIAQPEKNGFLNGGLAFS